MRPLLTTLGCLALAACASSPPSSTSAAPPPMRSAATCRELAAHAQALVATTPTVDGARPYAYGTEAPFGTCLTPANLRGSWALTLDALRLDSVTLPGPDGDFASPTPATFATVSGTLVYVLANGATARADPPQARFAHAFFFDAGGARIDDLPDAPASFAAEQVADWDADGIFELAISQGNRLAIWQFARAAGAAPDAPGSLVPFAAGVLPELTEVADLDHDGLPDLRDDAFFSYPRPGREASAEDIGPATQAGVLRSLPLWAHAVRTPTGVRFVTDDAATQSAYDSTCAGLGTAPWLGVTVEQTVLGLACARIRGASLTSVAAALRAEFGKLAPDVPPETQDIFETALAAIDAWSTRPMPPTRR